MRSELILKFRFEASHSLSGYEDPHPHLWILEFTLGGEIRNGKIIDMVEVRDHVEEFLVSLKTTYLNDNLELTENARKAPTCETLGEFFKEKFDHLLNTRLRQENPTIHLISTEVCICSMESVEIGSVRIL